MAAKTAKAGKAVVSDWVPNATYPEKPEEALRPNVMETWVEHGIGRRRTVHFYGDHGIGKTSVIKDLAKKRGRKLVYINLANITPDDKMAVAPVRTADGSLALRQMVTEDLAPGEPFWIYLDDGRQATQKVQNQFMQLACDWKMGMQDLEGLEAVVMSDNEGASEGIRTSEDPAVADRKVTVRLTANDTGWRLALARKYARVNLRDVFNIWDSLTAELRHVLSPRCLDHVIYCALNGFPLIFGLPLMGADRVRLTSTGAKGPATDKTSEILNKIAAALHVRNPESCPDLVRKVIAAALRDRLTVLIQGPPGCGKTGLTKAMLAESDLDTVYYSMPFTDPETLVVPMPTAEGTLKMLVAQELIASSPYAIVWDEYNRPTSAQSFAKLMEITQEWEIAGNPLTGCRAQIALCNPPTFQGRAMAVTKNNIAQADRFTISVQIAPEDIDANEWLIAKYGNVAEVVLEWWKNDISDAQRDWITKRTLERLITLHLDGLPMENGKMYLGEGEFAPVSLIDLELRLAKRPKTRLDEIATNVDEWIARLKKADEVSAEGTEVTDKVHQAMTLAELSQLRRYADEVGRLLAYLPSKFRGALLTNANTEHQEFWIMALKRCMVEINDSKAANAKATK